MNTQEACSLLGIDVNCPVEDVKKSFKKKVIEFHPDKNKSPDAEATFKKINEAYQFLEKNGTAPINDQFHGGFTPQDINDQINQFFYNINNRQPRRTKPEIPIHVNISITFPESVLGCSKEIAYERNVKCSSCNGSGKMGESQCPNCKGLGYTKNKEVYNINIAPGLVGNQRTVIRGKGHYNSGDLYDSVIIATNIIPDPDMRLDGVNVISNIELTLLEALKGTKKIVRTIQGDRNLGIPAMTKNGDQVRVAGFGIPPHGSHIFIVNVKYPDDVSNLITVLEENNNKEK